MGDLFLSYTEAFKKMIYVSQIYQIEKVFRENDFLSCSVYPVTGLFTAHAYMFMFSFTKNFVKDSELYAPLEKFDLIL